MPTYLNACAAVLAFCWTAQRLACIVLRNAASQFHFLHCRVVECTYVHFQASSNCPVCRKTLGANDFTEIVVADPPSTSKKDRVKGAFQAIFVKSSAASNELMFEEICNRVLHRNKDRRRTLRFVMKQFVLSNMGLTQRMGSMGCGYQKLQQEHTKLQQTVNNQRLQQEKLIADLQHRVQSLTTSNQDLQAKVDEKDRQIQQFRSLYAEDGERRVPSIHHAIPGSSHSTGSSSQGRNAPPPPMQRVVDNKMRQEQTRHANLDAMTRSRNVLGPHSQKQQYHFSSSASVDSVITPIVPPPQYQGRDHHSNNRSRQSGNVIDGMPLPPSQSFRGVTPRGSSPRIRDLAPAYQFTTRPFSASHTHSNKRPRITNDGYAPSSSIGTGVAKGRR